MEDLRACGVVRLGRRRRRRAARTDLDGRNAEAARLEDYADAAGRYALAEPANHPAGDQDVLHLASPGNLGPDKSHAAARRRRRRLPPPQSPVPRDSSRQRPRPRARTGTAVSARAGGARGRGGFRR